MYVANAHKQSKRSKSQDSPVSAGVGKLPGQTVTNKTELKELGERMGWKVRPLTEREIRGSMSAQEVVWHEVWNSDNYKAAFTAEESKKTTKANVAAMSTKRMWAGQATEEESQQAYAAGERFASNYASFVRNVHNSETMVLFMAENNLDATKSQSYVEAFEVLAPQCKLVLSPKNAGIGPEETVSGESLKNYPRLHLLCQPNKVLKPEDKLSADEYFALHKDTLGDKRVPPIILQKQQLAAATTKHFEQVKSGTAEGQAVRFTDQGGKDYPGFPAAPTKYSFRKLVDSVSSTELAQRCQQDPAFKKALDEME